MGWKSTLTLSRKEAIQAIAGQMNNLDELDNEKLGDMMDDIFGDDTDLPYYGHNFIVCDEEPTEENQYKMNLEPEKVNLFLDDERIPWDCIGYAFRFGIRTEIYTQEKWVIIRNYEDFVKYLTLNGLPKLISFDHDLGNLAYEHGALSAYQEFDYDKVNEKTGMDCAKWLVDYCIDNKLELPEFVVHSMNTAGRENIKKYLENFNERDRS